MIFFCSVLICGYVCLFNLYNLWKIVDTLPEYYCANIFWYVELSLCIYQYLVTYLHQQVFLRITDNIRRHKYKPMPSVIYFNDSQRCNGYIAFWLLACNKTKCRLKLLIQSMSGLKANSMQTLWTCILLCVVGIPSLVPTSDFAC